MPRLALLLLTTLLLAATAGGAEFERQYAFTAERFEVRNLIGQVTLEPSATSRWEVVVAVRGRDADPERIGVELVRGGKVELVVGFPPEQHAYVYPRLGPDGKTSISGFDAEPVSGFWDTLVHLVRNGLGSDRITVRGTGDGLEVWADVTVRVPADATITAALGVGELRAAGLTGEAILDTHAAAITVDDHTGRLLCDTGGGAVTVTDHGGGELTVDTGSGPVAIARAETTKLLVDTGSGAVDARAIGADRVLVDTGSGAVHLDLARLGTGRSQVDTGSGDVRVELPAAADLTLSVDTGSGAIAADLPGATVVQRERSELRLRLGGGTGHLHVDTGSGDVTLARRSL
jgi:hypothetical protein